MQAIVDESVGHIAQIGVQALQEFVKVGQGLFPADLQVALQLGFLHRAPEHGAQDLQLAGIFQAGLVVLLDQVVHLGQVLVQVGVDHHRGHVVDDAGGRAPLGLGALPWIVDDVRVDVGQIHDGQFGIALPAESRSLTGQPLQGAVLADVPAPHRP